MKLSTDMERFDGPTLPSAAMVMVNCLDLEFEFGGWHGGWRERESGGGAVHVEEI